MKSARRRVSRAEALKVAAVLAAVAACDSGEVSGPPAVPASLAIAPASAALTYLGETVQFTARVTGGTGSGGAGTVRWSSTDEAVLTVDGAGLATARGNGTAEVRASMGSLNDAASVAVEQRASALEVFGGGQQTVPGLSLPGSVGVQVQDAAGRPVAGTDVRFTVIAGDGSVDPESVASDGSGVASTVWTVGATLGPQKLVAAVTGGPEAEITAMAVGPDSAVAAVELQFGGGVVAGLGLTTRVIVRLADGAGRPVAGALATFVPGPGGGSVQPDSVRSDSLGVAAVWWRLGPTAGDYTLVVTSGEVRLEVTATAVDPNSLVAAVELLSGGGQSAGAGQTLPEPVVVRAVDGAGRPVSGVLVTFVPGPESGSVQPDSARSSYPGASTRWTLGASSGVQTLVVAAGGARLEVTATAVDDPTSLVAAVELLSGGGQSAGAGQTLPEPVVVRAVDGAGRPVSGALIEFTTEPEGASANPDSVRTNGMGLASTVWRLGPQLGEQRLAVSVPAGPRAAITATAVDPTSVVTRVIRWSGDKQWGVVGQPLPEPVVVQALDETGRPVPGVVVRFTPEAGAGSVEPGSVRSDSAGLAWAEWTPGPAPGEQTLLVTVASVARLEMTATAQPDAGICGRTRAVIEELVAKTGAESCAVVTEEHLASVEDVVLADRGITDLRSGDFAGLLRLRSLWLTGNRLKTLPPDLFLGLNSLESLHLGWNQLESLPPGILTGLPNLEDLRLLKNQLTAIPPEVADLTGLKNLELGFNPLTDVPTDLFAGLTRLEQLDLTDVGLEELPPDIFRGLTRLSSLSVARNQLTRLPPGVFDDLPNLKWLWLSLNRLTELPPGVFRNQRSLSRLFLGKNQLRRLESDVFTGSPDLAVLILERNELVELPAGVFDGLPGLKTLGLEWNRLGELPADIFKAPTGLGSLHLDGNGLSVLSPGIFEGLGELRWLRLGSNALTELPPGIFNGLHGLVELDLFGNALEELPPGVFAGLSNLVRLDLRWNPGAPFPVSLELARTDAADVLAPGPASVVMRVPVGAPLSLDVPVSVQGGSASGGSFSVAGGDTSSAALEVSRPAGGAGAVHLSLGPAPPTGVEVRGLEYVVGGQMALFAPSENRTPVVAREVPRHWLQAGVRPAEVEVAGHFSDPDGDTLMYTAASGDAAVVTARVENGVLVLEPLSEGSAVVEVTAEDPDGLRATLGVPVRVARAPDPEDFHIELIFIEGGTEAERFTESEKASVRRAAARWMEVVTGDLPDVPAEMDFCVGPGRMVGRIDDLVINVYISEAGGINSLAQVSGCSERESGLALIEAIWFNRTYFDLDAPETGPYSMYEVGLHEMGHSLGIASNKWDDMLRDPTPHDGVPRDTHFPGALAVEAFNEAGGWPYTGGKVPVDNGVSVSPNNHWRYEVLRGELMAPVGGGALSAITVQALADLGYEVDAGRADPYELPALDKAPAADAGVVEPLFAGDVIRGPVLVLDETGKVVRIIRN